MESNDQRGRDRLDGWKEIAAFLARDVRTAQRWERELGLPVHRKGGSGRPSIFAFVAELEAWLATDREQGARLTAPWLLNRRIALLAACCTVGFILGVSWLLRSADSVPVFRPDGWILVLDLENETQDPDLSETLKFALRRELRRYRHCAIVIHIQPA